MISRSTDRVVCVDSTQSNRRGLQLKLGAVYDVVDIVPDCSRVRVAPVGGKSLIGWYDASRFREANKTKEV